MTNGNVELGCDGEEAYKIATRYTYEATSKISHHDLTTKLHNIIEQSPVLWKFRHVSGHQDKIKQLLDLDIWERLNVQADDLAKAYLWETIESGETTPLVPDLMHTMPSISITINNERQYIYSRTVRTMHNLIAEQRSLRYWSTHNRPVLHNTADLDILRHAANSTASWNKRWLSKWQSGMCGVGVNPERWKDQNHSRCPRCQTERETVQHVLRCSHEGATDLWSIGVEEIVEWMKKNHSAPGLADIVGRRLRAWQQGVQPPPEEIYDNRIYQIIRDMDSIRWDFALASYPSAGHHIRPSTYGR